MIDANCSKHIQGKSAMGGADLGYGKQYGGERTIL